MPTATKSETIVEPAAPTAVGGMGAILLDKGVAFRVWAPHAERVAVVGGFNEFDAKRDPLTAEDNGFWYGVVESAKAGDEYKFAIKNGEQELSRIDPYARQVTNSVGNGVVYHDDFDWEDDNFRMPSWNELVIYELHIGTFARSEDGEPGSFDDAIKKLRYLKALGINCVEVMPIAEFAGDLSWGYNPAHIFSVETTYGGPDGFKRSVKAAHALGLAVIQGWYALKRSTLGAGLVLTAPGLPMLFQGQTILEDGWFQDVEAVEWSNARKFSGVTRLYRDLIRLRLHLDGFSRGLTGQHITVHHVNNGDKVIAFLRQKEGGADDQVLIVANFSAQGWENYEVGVPVAGRWIARFNSDRNGYREDLENFPVLDVVAHSTERDGQPATASVAVSAYSLSIYTLAAE